MISEWIRFVLGATFIFIGLVIFVFEIAGVYRFKYVLNRMHAAAMGDTLGIGSSLLGLAIISGFNFNTLKLGLIIVFFWLASPVSSHMLARMETSINEKLTDNLEESSLEEVEKREAEK